MIISHEHRFIFLKTRKTAGTSVEIALAQQCGPDDVITSLNADDTLLSERLGGLPAQNYEYSLRRYTARDLTKWALGRGRATAKNHDTAAMVRAHVSSQVWNGYFKFTVIRNPWDAMVSGFWFWHDRDKVPFSEWLGTRHAEVIAENWNTYTIDGSPIAEICRHETLAADLESLRIRIGLPQPLKLPHAKGGLRKDRRPLDEVYSDEDARRVATMCKAEIDRWGYVFPKSPKAPEHAVPRFTRAETE